jgi:thioredoxin-like negative regulator of GroEL
VTVLPLVALLLAAPAGKAAKPVAGSVQWENGFSAALQKAKATGKPVMIDFWAEWCGYCHLLDRTTYRDATVVRRAAGFVSVKVNTEGSDEESRIAGRYLVGSLPTILFVSPAGRPILRLNGYLPAARFAAALTEVSKRAPLVMNQEAALDKDPQNPEALASLGLHMFAELSRMAEQEGAGRMSKQVFEDTKDLLTRAYRVDEARPPLERKRVRSALGIVQGYQGKFAECAAMLKEAIALSPADATIDARAYGKLGQVYVIEKKNDLARQTFRKLVKRYPQSPEAEEAQEYLLQLENAPR